jgi:hypothetical protein
MKKVIWIFVTLLLWMVFPLLLLKKFKEPIMKILADWLVKKMTEWLNGSVLIKEKRHSIYEKEKTKKPKETNEIYSQFFDE